MFLGHGSSLGGHILDSKLMERGVVAGGQAKVFDPPILSLYYVHLECAGLSESHCEIPDMSTFCIDVETCRNVSHFLHSCSECYSKEPDKYIRNSTGGIVKVEGARKANCTTANGDSAPSWYVCDKMFDRWCKVFPQSRYCDRGSRGKFYAPNPCEGRNCSMRGTCNQYTGECECQWAYKGPNCEDQVMTTFGHWTAEVPTCEANRCEDKRLRHQTEPCVGATGDVCIPRPEKGFVCKGQLVCMPDGAFHGEAECIPKEPCGEGGRRCHHHAHCVNGKCECARNYWGDGVEKCALWDACAPGTVEDIPPSSTNNRVCRDVDECLTNNGGCQQRCINLDGSHQCACQEGYTLSENSRSCERKKCDPLLIANAATACVGKYQDTCRPKCKENYESVGSFVCEASGDFLGDGRCRGLPCDELVIANGDETQPCEGMAGSSCIPVCRKGFFSQGYLQCTPPNFTGDAACIPNECPPLEVPNALERCEGRTGEVCASLRCKRGFFFHGEAVCSEDGLWQGLVACKNVNECRANNGKGACDQRCTDTFGSYECSCEMGYSLAKDGHTCLSNGCPDLTYTNWNTTCSGDRKSVV